MMDQELSKRLCLERDSYRCRHCGVSMGVEVIQLIKGNTWLLSNLITLCDSCIAAKEQNENNGRDDLVGVILAGGKGTRVYPLTKYQNKHTLPIGLTPMIFYPLKTIRSFGIKKCLVIMDRENTGTIINMLGSGKEFGMDLSYRIQEGAGGISDALYLAKDFIQLGQKIICVLGDNIFDNDTLEKNISNNPCVYVKKVSNPQDYGVAEIEAGKIKRIVEKPKEYVSDMAVVGLYVYNYDVFSVIENTKPSARGELEISSVNDHYASTGELEYKMVNGFWGDAGSSIQKYAECGLYGAKKANVSEEDIESFKNTIFDGK